MPLPGCLDACRHAPATGGNGRFKPVILGEIQTGADSQCTEPVAPLGFPSRRPCAS
jgi:hypothetical protein